MKALIIGGGIGGLTTALCLHRAGIECEIFEQAHAIRELGVGINMLPHATKALAELGLLGALDRVGVRTHELLYKNRFGQTLWRELRGCDAGYDYPQFSIHRGQLQGVLYEAVRARLGNARIHTAHQLEGFSQDESGVTARFALRSGGETRPRAGATSADEVARPAAHSRPASAATARGDLLIAADGIHSKVRHILYPNEGAPRWNGVMLWRGTVPHPPFLTGRSMIISGGMSAKLVLYPVCPYTGDPRTNLLNWAVAATLSDGSTPPPRREDWSRPGRLEDVMPHVDGVFALTEVDPLAAIRATPEFYEYPMCDRDPLPQWSFGRVTLLGDAAHPMYPVGSNGASQAILDALCLGSLLASHVSIESALRAYDDERRPVTAKIVHDNRTGGPERVIDVVEQRAPNGFTSLDDVATHAELEAIVKGYSKMAGFGREQVNK